MKLIVGQEAVVPTYGLGRIVSFDLSTTGYKFIEVRPYICNYEMKFDPANVKLVKIFYEGDMKNYECLRCDKKVVSEVELDKCPYCDFSSWWKEV